MIDLLLSWGGDPTRDSEFQREVSAYVADVRASAGKGQRRQVEDIEAVVKADPTSAFVFDEQGRGTLEAGAATFPAGRFETLSIASLRTRALASREACRSSRVRLWVLLGTSPATDIGSLQANAGPKTLFQVASQFNCLESPGPFVSPIARYFHDSTQGPRAAISAFPGTFLRHYAAPSPEGKHFVQTTDGPQLNLLEDVSSPHVARVKNGYLVAEDTSDPVAFRAALEDRFEEIRVGVHNDVPVVLGYDWDGAVTGDPRIAQVFTSTFAAGGYSGVSADTATYRPICRALLRAAYLGTLLAAVVFQRPNVVLTLIGGGAFGNPMPLIWDSILWAVEEVDRIGCGTLEVVVNSRNLRTHLSLEEILNAVRPRGGAAVEFSGDRMSIQR